MLDANQGVRSSASAEIFDFVFMGLAYANMGKIGIDSALNILAEEHYALDQATRTSHHTCID